MSEFNKIWDKEMGYRMKGSKYLAKKFYKLAIKTIKYKASLCIDKYGQHYSISVDTLERELYDE